MTLKRPAANKRTVFPRSSDYTKSFQNDWKRLSRSGRYDMNRLKEAMLLLIANNGPLLPEWRDHSLEGDWDGYPECHIVGDFFLVYKFDRVGKNGMVVFVRAGTHSELFE